MEEEEDFRNIRLANVGNIAVRRGRRNPPF
jgi:hypothetical protein